MAESSKRPTYHIVSHSHWDREWYFPFDRFRAMLVDMIEDLIVLFRKNKEFKSYTLDGQMAALMDYLEVRPDRREQIKGLVEKKKLFIGPWYILNDEFLSSGESIVRNLLFGFRMGKELGGVMPIGYIPDQFGHIAQMPQILLGFGMDKAMFYRGFGGEPGQEGSEYWWVSPDGSRVLLHHLPKDGYSAGYFGVKDEHTILEVFQRMRKELDARATTSHRLFFNGGDHHWPDEAVTTAIRVLQKKENARIIHSNFVDYFSCLKKELGSSPDLPVLLGETRFGYRYAFVVLGGVFSSRMYLKQMNVACENMLTHMLEPLNVLATWKGMRSKSPQIEQAWKYVLQNQDHDAICGTSSDEVHQEMVIRFKKAKQIGDHVSAECFAQLLPYDETARKDERYLFIFNPLPFERQEIVETSVEFYRQDVVVGLNPDVKVADKLPPVKALRLLDEDGKRVPVQILAREEGFGITYSKHNYPSQTQVDRFKILVDAGNLPAMGWIGLAIEKTETVDEWPLGLRVGERWIENEFLKVEAATDGIVSVFDKVNGVKIDRLNVFEDSGDVGDEYNYSYPERDMQILSTGFPATVNVIERGPLRAVMQVQSQMMVPSGASADGRKRSDEMVELQITSLLTLTLHARRVDVRTTVHNAAKDHRLRVMFDTGIPTLESFADTPFAVVRREHRKYDVSQFRIEHPAQVAPMQRFVTLAGDKGFTLLAKGLPEYEVKVDKPGLLALTLLRCVGKLSGRDLITRPGGAAGWWTETPEAQCPGIHVFEYSIFPHSAGKTMWPPVLREAESYALPPTTVKRKNEQSVLKRSFLSVEPAGLELSALKESEKKRGFIIRLGNPVDQTVEGHVHFEIPIARATLCMLDEKPIKVLRVIKGHDLTLSVKPFSVMTIHLTPQKK